MNQRDLFDLSQPVLGEEPEAPFKIEVHPGNLQRILFVPDTHVPFEDPVAFTVMLESAKVFKPDIIVTLGDFFDFYAVSAHRKDPRRKDLLSEEVAKGLVRLRQLDAIGAKQKIFIAGNHEDRLERYLADRAPELFDLAGVSIRDVLQLDEMGWEYVPYKTHKTLGRLHLTHDTGNAGQYAHYRAQATFEGNVIIGHTHRLGYMVVGNAQGKPHVGAMFGWLGDVKAVEYMHRVAALRQWAHGFGTGFMEPNGNIHVTPVPIVDGAAVVDGKLVTVRGPV